MKYFLPITLLFLTDFLVAQTGPGGFGTTDGSSNLVLWLKADQGVTTSGTSVTTWADQSGYGYDASVGGGTPTFNSSNTEFGGMPSIVFDGSSYLYIEDDANEAPGLDNTSELSVFIVFNSDNASNTLGIVSKRDGTNVNQSYVFYHTNTIYSRINSQTITGASMSTATSYIHATTYENGNFETWLSQVVGASYSGGTASIPNYDADLNIGNFHTGDTRQFDGDIAEIIILSEYLNDGARVVMENYLAEKYGLTLTDDFYTNGAGYLFDVSGIGRSDGDLSDEGNSSGMATYAYDASSVSDDEFVLTGHSNTTNSIVTTDLPTDVVQRWNKDWYVDVTGTVNIDLGFDFSDGINGQYPQTASDYVLLKRNGTTGTYSEVSVTTKYSSGDKIYFRLEDVSDSDDAYYTLGTSNSSTAPLDGGDQKVWYTYKSGDWDDYSTWTLDGAVSALYDNPGLEIPGSTDQVVIKSGKTVTVTSDDTGAGGIELIGTLDIGETANGAFGEISGTGRLILDGAGGSENFPLGNYADFVSSDGGTVEIQGTGITLDEPRTFNNLILNLSSGTAVLTADYVINGDFSINSGAFQINDNSSTTSKTIDLYGDFNVASGGSVTVGTANARHDFNFYGDLNNDGSIAFTQRTSATVGSQATDGIVDANFLNTAEDQYIQCNNTAIFYRIEIDKGDDDTYTLHIDSEDASYFGLYGYASQSHGASAQLTSNTNALGLLKGTVRIGENVTINGLTASGNYNVSEAAKLWVDGGTVTMTSGNALVPYGGILVSDGSLTAGISSGITTRGNGYLEVTGGKVEMNQFRTSVYGSENQGGYSQSGGEVYVTGSPSSGSYYSFSLTYEGNTFAMTGGVLTVDANSKGGIFINGSEGNYDVQGGEVVCQIQNNTNFVITSKAPFYNLTLRKTANYSKSVILAGGSTSGGSDDVTLSAQSLVVLNDLILQNTADTYTDFDGNTVSPGYNVTFNANSVDVTIGGNLTIGDGSTFTSGSNTVTFDGSGNSFLQFGTSTTQNLYNFVVDKKYADQNVQLSTGNSTSALQVNGDLTLNKGKLFYKSLIINAKGDVVLKDTIGTSTATGKLTMSGTSAQTITSTNDQAIYNLEVNNSSGVGLEGDISVLGTLTLSSGVFDINTYQLLCLSSVATTGTFSSSLMIQTAGNASDGGLALYVDEVDTYFYPIGTDANSDARYTPVSLVLDTYYDNGYIALSVGDLELSTLSTSGSALSYYWETDYTGFSTVPLIGSIDFTYSNNDTGTGAQLTSSDAFVPGRVLNYVPYTRTALSDVIDGTNTFTYDPGSPFSLVNAHYTAGTSDKFDGSIRIFYANRNSFVWNADWTDPTMWSTVSDVTSTYNEYGEAPGENDIAVIGYETNYADNSTRNRRNINIDGDAITVAGLVIERDVDDPDCQYCKGILTISENTATSLDVTGSISGNGVIQYQRNHFNNGQGAALTYGDIGEFVTNDEAIWIMRMDGEYDTQVDYITDRFPNLYVNGDGGDYDYRSGVDQGLIFGDDITCNTLIIGNSGALKLDTLEGGSITVLDSAYIGSSTGWNPGRIIYQDRGYAKTVSVAGNLTLGTATANTSYPDESPSIIVFEGGTESVEHSLEVGGNIKIVDNPQGDPVIDLYTDDAGGANVVLTLTGEGNHQFINYSDSIPELYRVVLDKGIDTTSSFSFDYNVLLPAATDGAEYEDKVVVIENGKLIFNHADLDVELTSGGADFDIPSTGGLQVTQGTASVSGDDVGIHLDGLLRINGGTVDLDDAVNNGNNYIEYSSSGSALIEISSGSLVVGSQVRRGLNSTSGVLNYTQTGGTVVLGQNAAPEVTRGVFEAANSSEFNFTGGDFTLVRGINSLTVASLLLEPETSSVSGTITIGNGDTPSGNESSRIGIKSSVAIYSLTLDNTSGNNPIALLYSRSLTLNGTLTTNTGTTLNANSYGLTLKGDFVNDGTYTPSGNLTTFSKSSGTQYFSGTGSSTFYDFVKSANGVLEVSKDIYIDGDFTVSAGTLDVDAYGVHLVGDATVKSTVTTNGGYGLIFEGESEQELFGKNSTDISIGVITVDNSNNISIPEGNGYRFVITEKLRLSQGVFDIGGSLLTIGESGEIEEVNTFSSDNMVQTNSSYADSGLKKVFDGTESDFTFPVGEGLYTPLVLAISSSLESAASITVKPADELHAAISDDASTIYNEEENALQYHWVVKSSGLSSSGDYGTATFYYDQSDVSITGETTDNDSEDDYIPARLISTSDEWDKGFTSPYEVDPNANTITFPIVLSSDFTGEYTAGVDNAFRDVPIYRTASNLFDFTDIAGWEVYNKNGTEDTSDDTWESADTKPVGARITILYGDTVAIDEDFVRLLSTEIEGALVVNGETYLGARLGEVTGTGTMVLNNDVLPSGNYDDFFTCSGGSLEYTSSTSASYSILADIPLVRYLYLTGSGTRSMPDNDVSICEDLIVDGPTLSNASSHEFIVNGDLDLTSGAISFGSSNANVTVEGSTTLTSGTFTGYSGADITFNGDLSKVDGSVTFTGNSADFMMTGSATQNLIGSFTMKKLTVDNSGGGIDLTSGGNLTISQTLTMTDGLITSSESNKVTLTSTGNYSGASSVSYFDGPVTKNSLAASATYTFPVGKDGRYAPVVISNIATGAQNWTAEYHTNIVDASIPTTTDYDATDAGSGLNALNEIKTTDRWSVTSSGANSAYVAVTYGSHDGYSNANTIRLIWWDASDSRWENVGDVVSGNATAGTVRSASAMHFSAQQFGLGNAPETTLPVDLVYFTGYLAENGSVILEWQTASEIDNDRFEIERMTKDGSEFEMLGEVEGAGTTDELLDYQFIDDSPYSGVNYYRLKQIDYDEVYEYSDIIVVNNDSYDAEFAVTLLPNPTTEDNINFRLTTGDETTTVSLTVLDLQGRKFYFNEILPELGSVSYQVTPVKSMPKGLYFIIITQGRNTEVTKLIIK